MKIFMRKVALALTVAFVVSLGLSSASLGAGKTLVFVAGPQGNLLWEQLIPQWEKQTGNKIEFTDFPRKDFDALLKARIVAGRQIDLIMYDPQFHLDYYRRGIPEDITNAFSDPEYPNLSENRFQEGALDFKRMAGKIYFVPINLMMTLYYYNKDMFEKYGIAIPNTYEEKTQVVTKLSDTDVIPEIYPGKGLWFNPIMLYHLLPMLTANNSDAFTKATARGDIKWTSPFYKRGLEILKWQMDSGILTREALGMDYDTSATIFLQGKVGMLMQGTWMYGEQFKPLPPGFNLGVFPIPAISPGFGQPCGCSDVNLSVYSGSKNKKEALSFIDFSASKESAELASQNYISSIKGALPKDPVLTKVVQLYEGIPIAHLVDHLWEPEITEAFKVQVQTLLLDRTTPEKVLEDVQEMHDNLVKEGKDLGETFGRTYSY